MSIFLQNFEHRTGRRTGVMLAYPLEEKRLAKWTPPYITQPKLDGERCRAVVGPSGEVTLFSSEANVIESVPHINKAIRSLALRNVELDGELYAHGLPLQSIHSIISRKVELHPQFDEIGYYIFDLVNSEPQAKRTIQLQQFPAKPPLFLVPFRICSTFEEVMSMLDWSIGEGFEGIIVRHLEATYTRRRSIYMMKFKPKRSDIYTVVGFEEEFSIHGQPKNRLGALICRAQFGEESFNVGSGFTAEQREALWLRRQTLPGLSVRVGYQSLTSNRGVPRSAVFIELLENEPLFQWKSSTSLKEASEKKAPSPSEGMK